MGTACFADLNMQCLPKFFKHLRYSRSALLSSVEKSNRFIYSISTAPQLAESVSKDFKTLNELWNQKQKSAEVNNFLFKCFSREIDSYSFTLDMLKYMSRDDSERFEDLLFTVILAFDTWLKQNAVNKPLTLDVKEKALELAIYSRNKLIVTMVSKVYKFQEDSAILKEYAEKLIIAEKFEEACVCVMTLGIQKEIPLEKILIPLVFRDRLSLILKYLEGNTDLQVEFVQKLDAMISDPGKERSLKTGRRKDKQICKIVASVAKSFNISSELVPTMLKVRALATMNFLLHRKFEKTMSDESWENLVSSVVQHYPDLQQRLVYKLVSHQELDAASKIAQKFNISISQSCQDIDKTSTESCETLESPCEEKTATENQENGWEQYLTLDVNKVEIKFVRSKEEFFDCLNDISENHEIVGMDSEWKTEFGLKPTRLSLMQLAVSNKVYILDMLSLNDCLSQKDWGNLMDLLFSNPKLLKLGCGIVQDIQMLVEDYRGPPQKAIKFSHMLDVAILFEQLQGFYKEELEEFVNDAPGTKGLSKLCKILLGKYLNKNERICDWELRPLSDSQVTYAALDANCLLQMIEEMRTRATKYHVNFERTVAIALDITTGLSRTAWKNRGSYKWMRKARSFTFQPSIPINGFGVVVDKSLATLAMKLRMFGVDVRVLSEEETCVDAMMIAREEKKFYLTTEEHREEVKATLDDDKYYLVSELAKYDEKTVALIFQKFNVHVASKSIFSRCMNCNKEDLLVIPSDDLKIMWKAALSTDTKTADNSASEIPEDVNHRNFEYDNVTISTDGIINSQVKIQLDTIPSDAFSSVQSFRVCRNCGNVHYQR